MPLDPSSVGTSGEPYRACWTKREAVTYALAIGAGVNELAYTTEDTAGVEQQVYPTYATIAGGPGPDSFRPSFGTFDLPRGLHGEQSVTLHRPLPVEGDVTIRQTVAAMYDKGEDAVVVLEASAIDNADGGPLFDRRLSIFIRGEGGWGGDRGPAAGSSVAPERTPDHEVTYQTSPDQALLYRLTGPPSRVHSDPQFAAEAGFERPNLAGLCTYGFVGRALLHTLADGDGSRFRHMEGRFARPVWPGEAITTGIWQTGPGEAVFSASVGDRLVMARGLFRYS